MSKINTYSKSERLKSRSLIGQVFEKGQVVKAYPLRAHIFIHDQIEYPALQVGFSVSKRYFKKAVDRNRVKRLLREAYRTRKEALYSQYGPDTNPNAAIMIIYNSPELPTQKFINKKISTLLQKVENFGGN